MNDCTRNGRTLSVAFIVGVTFFVGCDAVPVLPPSDDALSLTTPFLRVLQLGDSWTYDERREGTVNDEPFTAVGTQTVNVLCETVVDLAGGTARVISGALDLVVNDETPVTISGRSYFSQDPDGTLYWHGETDESVDPPIERFVQTPVEGRFRSLASPIIVGATNQSCVTYDDGTTVVAESTVVAVERVSVPAGQFVAWRIEGTQTKTTGTAVTSYEVTSWRGASRSF